MRLLPAALLMALSLSCPALQAESLTDTGYLAAMAAMHADDAPLPSAIVVEEPRVPVTGVDVVYATVSGKPVHGYLSRPADARGPLPGIIVIHEWWGLNDNIRRTADRLAGEGYETLAVDLYGGQAATTPDASKQLMMAVMSDPGSAKDNLRQAYAYLHDHEQSPKMGVIGWCFGGGWALQTALMLPDKLDAVVMYYGQPVTDVAQLAKLTMHLLGFFGEEDKGITVADVRAFQQALKEAKVDAEIREYPHAGHAFANPSGEHYQKDAAQDSWTRTVRFFDARLHAH